MKGVFLDIDTVDRGDLDLAELEKTLPTWQFLRMRPAQNLAALIGDAQVVITNKVLLDQAALSAASKVQLICIAATGTNNVDLPAASRAGISVCNVRGYATTSVVEHVFGVLLQLCRNLPKYQTAVANGDWQRCENFCLLDYPISELSGRTLGIIGYGELGKSVAKLARAFGMHVLAAERRGVTARKGRTEFESTLRQSDVISIHCPLDDSTRELIGAAELRQMKTGAWLIQTARGGIVDEAALALALRSGQLGGAAVDVLSEEPPKRGNPLLDPDIPNLIITPHTAWASRETRQRLIEELAENIHAFLVHRPRNLVQ